MITIVDYGLGNIHAFLNVYKRLKIDACVAQSSTEIEKAEKLILPGVGAFDYAMSMLNKSGMRDSLDKKVLIEKVPVLGICVGMQMMANSSDEGKLAGLGWIDGEVKLFDTEQIIYKTKLPHMGWNQIEPKEDIPIFNQLHTGDRFYFLHSYYMLCHNPNQAIASVQYGMNVTCAVQNENIFGVQFHPEKSHQNGVQLLNNFAQI